MDDEEKEEENEKERNRKKANGSDAHKTSDWQKMRQEIEWK